MDNRHRGGLITPDIFVAIMLALWTVLNIFQCAFTDLSADEAYYFVISRTPDFGYFDHPPMNMWLIYLSTLFFGDGEFGIRFLTVLLQPVYLYLFWLTIKSEKSNMASAVTYLLIAFSMPMLQVWGWVATPDASLMFFAALLLWFYRQFLETDKLEYALGMGASIALLGYSKYHGVLFVAFLFLSNIKLLRSWKFWSGIALAAVLFLPHMYWQYSNDWVSLRYHLSGRTDAFEWENLWVYILNLATTFNPFLTILLLFFVAKKALVSYGKIGSAMKWITCGFVFFFLWSVRNVHVQAQWLLLVTYPVIYFVFVAAEERPFFRNFVRKQGLWVGAVFIVARLFLMCCPPGLIEFDMVNSKQAYASFAQKLDTLPFFGNSNYQFSSKLAYYGDIQSYGRPSVDCRSSQYEFLDMENSFKGRTVAVEITQFAKDSLGIGMPIFDTIVTVNKIKKKVDKKTVVEEERIVRIEPRHYHYDTILDNQIVWDTIQNYLPTEKIRIVATGIPTKVHTANTVVCNFEVTNPYDYDIPVSGPYGYKLFMNIRYGRFSADLFSVGWPKNLKVLPANSTYKFTKRLVFPKMITSGEGTYGFAVMRLPFGGWYNSERKPITITNIIERTLVKNTEIARNKMFRLLE